MGAGPAAGIGRLPDLTKRPVPSPCVNICRMDAQGHYCEGCQRTLDEIAAWGSLPDAAKLQVWQRLIERRAARQTATTLQPPP